ncbi:MAG: hypothetical protein ACI8T1_001291 [Verrucomicrobiales bacterium]|jgi:hypothetical protein
MLTLVLALGCLGMGKRASKHIVSFHVQTEPEFAASKRVFEWPVGSGYFYEKSPTIHHKQIRAFSAFDGDDGGWGAVFRLSTAGRNQLQAVTQSHPGKLMLAVVLGEPRAVTKMDRYNDDGQIVIWEKLRPEDMEIFEKKFSTFQ